MLRKTIILLALAVLAVSCGKEKEKVAPAPAAKADKQAPPDLSWSEKTSLPPGKRVGHTCFVINGKSCVFGGFDGFALLGDLWEYDPQTDQWTQRASLPAGMERRSAASFVINGKGYVVGGLAFNLNQLTSLGDLWEYDPSNNTWTQKASLPGGEERHAAIGFSVAEKGFIATGADWQILKNFGDLWEYSPAGDTWTKRASLPPGKERTGAVGFVLFDKLYVVAGVGNGYLKDLWQYDPVAYTWTEKASLPPNNEIEDAASFVVGNKGYLVGGFKNKTLGNVWEYDPVADSWKEKQSLPAEKSRYGASGFALNGKGYVIGGRNGNGLLDDLLEYDPTKDQ